MSHEIRLQKASRAVKHMEKSGLTALMCLYEVDVHKSYRTVRCTTLTSYLENILSMAPAAASVFVTVIRKSQQVPALKGALASKAVTISQARTIASVITAENASKWIALCACCSVRDLEHRVAQEKPEAAPPERVRFKAKDQVVVTVTLPEAGYGALQRGQEILKQSEQTQVGLGEAVDRVFQEFVEREDPVRKAERKLAEKRSEKEKALVRDQGACQFQISPAKKCSQRYWIDIYHIIPRSQGGPDTAENMITLCSGHHRMEHATSYTTH